MNFENIFTPYNARKLTEADVPDILGLYLENNVKKIDYVTLEIGEVSGVIHDQLVDCWNWARKKRSCDRTCKNLY